MAAATGKKHERDVAAAHGDPVLTVFQDFDWADEVQHARTGRALDRVRIPEPR